MQIAASKDKIEAFLNTRPDKGILKWLDFPSRQTPITETTGLAAVSRQTFVYFSFITFCFAIAISFVLTLIIILSVVYYKLHIHHLRWRLFKILYSYAAHYFFRDDPLWGYMVIILVFSGVGCAFLFAQRWAWNRRADRLRHEPPPPLAVVSAGVWPPPPSVSSDL